MEITKELPNNIVGRLQMNAAQFECAITELGVMGGGNARVTLSGSDEQLQALFEYVGEPLDDENESTPTI